MSLCNNTTGLFNDALSVSYVRQCSSKGNSGVELRWKNGLMLLIRVYSGNSDINDRPVVIFFRALPVFLTKENLVEFRSLDLIPSIHGGK
jgi:hypothetical protein